MSSSSKTNPGMAPPTRLRYLDGVVEYLWDARNMRGLICLVERWSTVEKPSKTGRLYQVRAFLALRLMDRAWLQLKKLLEADPDDMEALSMATEMFLDRGWPSRARKLLLEAQERMPGAPELPKLLELTEGPPRTPPPNAREIEQQGSPAELLELAERFLSTGSFLRARALLERVRQAEPTNARAKDLLWGLDGDFDAGDVSPEELAAQLAPTFQDHGMNFIDLEPPGAEEVTATRIPLEDDDIAEAEFPALFRRVGSPLPTLDDDTGEVTQARHLASPAELQDPSSAPPPDSYDPLDGKHEDTEIMMVIPSGSGGLESVDKDAPVHRKRSQDYDLRSTLDLQEYRRTMGVSAPSLSDLVTQPDDTEESDLSVSLEDEDADLVVVTRKEQPRDARPKAPRPAATKPIRVVEKHPTAEPEPEPEAVPVGPTPRPASSATGAPTPAPATEPPHRRGEPPASEVLAGEDDIELPRGRRTGLLLILPLGAAAFLGGLLFLLPRLGLMGPDAAIDQVARAIAADRYDALLQAEAAIDGHLPEGDGQARPEVLAAAARAELALWTTHQPYPERLDEAVALVQRALAADPPAPEAHLAAAELAAWQWRVADARDALAAYGQQDAASALVQASLASIEGDAKGAVEAANQAVQLAPRSAQAARVLTALQLEAEAWDGARDSLELLRTLAPDGPRTAILGLLLDHREDPSKLPTAARELSAQLAERYTPARAEAELFERVAERLPGTSRSATRTWALDQAFAKDSTDPDLLRHFALEDCRQGRHLAALDKLERALRFRPGDPDLRLAMTRLLVDLDRMAEAREQASLLEAARPGHPELALLRAWPPIMDALPTAEPARLEAAQQALATVLEREPLHPEALWLSGLAKLAAGQRGALTELTTSSEELLDAKDPDQRALLSRSLASLVLAGHPGTPRLLEHLERNAQSDPWAHIFLAWSNARRGARNRAVDHLAKAVEAGPELARAHYEQAAYLRSPDAARTAFGRYLALEPNGDRAESAQTRVR